MLDEQRCVHSLTLRLMSFVDEIKFASMWAITAMCVELIKGAVWDVKLFLVNRFPDIFKPYDTAFSAIKNSVPTKCSPKGVKGFYELTKRVASLYAKIAFNEECNYDNELKRIYSDLSKIPEEDRQKMELSVLSEGCRIFAHS